jgi:hypothetical protein
MDAWFTQPPRSGAGREFTLFVLERWQVADRGLQPGGVESLDQARSLGLYLVTAGPGGSVTVDELGFVKADGRFHERVGRRLRLRLIPTVRHELSG